MNHQVSSPLRVLFIEDSEDDVLLEVAELEKAGFHLSYMCVDNQTTLEDALEKEWDIILSDYNMPKFSGTEALHAIRKLSPDVPVILISGVISEIDAVEIMKAGAQDYVNKRHMARLTPVVERELKEARIRKQHDQARKHLVESERQYRMLVEYSPDIIYRFSNIHGGVYYSPRVTEVLGYSPEMLKNNNMLWHDSIHSDDLPRVDAAIKQFCNGGRYDLEYRIRGANGDWLWLHDRCFAIHRTGDEVLSDGLATDITERKEAEQRTLNALHEKEALLRELHHRVMNNMQIISSMLSLQSRYLHTNDAQQILSDSRQRIRAMALVHERMYTTANPSKINFIEYMRYLAEHLARLHHSLHAPLDIRISGDKLEFSVDQALPCALIVNELITNSIKHAYPNRQENNLIELTIDNIDDNTNRIIVRDHGIGIPAAAINAEPETMGMLIIHALAKQIDGSVTFEIDDGTVAILQFPHQDTILTERLPG